MARINYPWKLSLIDVVLGLPSIKRIALQTFCNRLANPKIVNVATFKKSEEYEFFKYNRVKYIAPEIQWNGSGDPMPYLLVVLG